MTWQLFWQIFLFGVLGIFAVMAVLVTILGARDIRKLIRGLKENDEDRENE
ncbi:MAG: hypothetical protein HKN23_00725 [Verrucomicrobiales bacterium]|nr:hypothetical protein [Verrucomicrobiales bacterium]